MTKHERTHIEFLGKSLCGQKKSAKYAERAKDATCGNCRKSAKRRNREGDW